jgi:hypothetical protein
LAKSNSTLQNRRKSAAGSYNEYLEGDPRLSAYAAVADHYGLPAVWPMFVQGTTRDMFEDATKIKRLVKLVSDYLDCSDAKRGNIEGMAAGLAELNRQRAGEEVAHV